MATITTVGLGDRRVTLEHLRAFVSIAEDGGFQRASEKLYRTQSAVTQSLRKLEEILGCRLLERRQGHIVGLTADGQRLLPAAREILMHLDDTISTMKRPRLSGRIRLGVPDDFRIAELHGAISHCLSLNRNLRIEVVSALSARLLKLLANQDLDVAIYKHTIENGGIGPHEVLWREPLHWVSHAPLAFHDVEEIALVSFPDGCAYRHVALQTLGNIGKPIFHAYESASYENIRRAISTGLGIGILPRSAIGRDHVILTPVEGFPELPEVKLSIKINSDGDMFEQFSNYLRQSAAFTLRESEPVSVAV